jgi:hypothetical protein
MLRLISLSARPDFHPFPFRTNYSCAARHMRSSLRTLQVPMQQAESEQLLAETKAIDAVESEYAADLDFGGISTSQVISVAYMSHHHSISQITHLSGATSHPSAQPCMLSSAPRQPS